MVENDSDADCCAHLAGANKLYVGSSDARVIAQKLAKSGKYGAISVVDVSLAGPSESWNAERHAPVDASDAVLAAADASAGCPHNESVPVAQQPRRDEFGFGDPQFAGPPPMLPQGGYGGGYARRIRGPGRMRYGYGYGRDSQAMGVNPGSSWTNNETPGYSQGYGYYGY